MKTTVYEPRERVKIVIDEKDEVAASDPSAGSELVYLSVAADVVDGVVCFLTRVATNDRYALDRFGKEGS